jgi:tetratricopeptide (TPR) repeat protein
VIALLQLLQPASARQQGDEREIPVKTMTLQKASLEQARLSTNDPKMHAETALALAINTLVYDDRKVALSLFQEALAAYKKLPADEADSDLATSFWTFIDMYFEKTTTRQEELSIVTSLVDVTEEKSAIYPRPASEHIIDIVSYFNKQHRPADAIAVLQHTLASRARLRPYDTRSVEILYFWLTEQYRKTGNLDEAVVLLNKWLESSEMHYGALDAEILPPLISLSAVEIELGNFDKADLLNKRILNIVSIAKPKSLTPLQSIIVAYQLKGELAAGAKFIRSLCSEKTVDFKNQRQLFHSVQMLAQKFVDKKDFREAQKLLQVWLAVLKLDSDDANQTRQVLCRFYLEEAARAQEEGANLALKQAMKKAHDVFSTMIAIYKKNKKDDAINAEMRTWDRLIAENHLPAEKVEK